MYFVAKKTKTKQNDLSSLQVIACVCYHNSVRFLIFILLFVLLSFSPNKLRNVTWIQLEINKFIQFIWLIHFLVLLGQFAVYSAAIYYKSLCSRT